MVREAYLFQELEIPENVRVEIIDKKVRVEGPLGVLEKDFSYAKKMIFRLENGKIVFEMFFAKKRDIALFNMVISKIKNMIIGVTKGFRYKMYIVYAHFPMSVKIQDNYVIIENFLGEKGARKARIVGDVKVKVTKDEVIIEGIDIEAVGQTAANIYEATRLRGKQRRSPHGRAGGPGILDGIYLYAKEHIQ